MICIDPEKSDELFVGYFLVNTSLLLYIMDS